MMKALANFFDLFRSTPAQIISRQFEQAERLHLAHAAEAERHRAMAAMYVERMARLVESLPGEFDRYEAKIGAGRAIGPGMMPMHMVE